MENYVVPEWSVANTASFTFVVTEACNLACKYCYETKKNNASKMQFEIAKKAADFMLEHFKDKSEIIIDFIGGEPLLEIDLMDKITDYIKFKIYQEKYKCDYSIQITTNGILYDSAEVQRYIKKNRNALDISISIDGNKIKHDSQRIKKDGTGSYDDVVKNVPLWLEQFPQSGSKVTFASEDLIYLKDSIIDMNQLGIENIFANVVNEDVWKEGDDDIFENQLKELADYMVEKHLDSSFSGDFFEEFLGLPYEEYRLKLNWCNCGENNLAVDCRGDLYPCIRFLPFTLNGKEKRDIGNIFEGIDENKLRAYAVLNFESQNDSECLECEVANGCQWCVGNNYVSSKLNTIFERDKAICKMHKARCRANDYYYAKLYNNLGIKRKAKNLDRKRYLYILLEDNHVDYCLFSHQTHLDLKIDYDILKNGLEYARHNFLKPVIVFGPNDIEKKYYNLLENYEIMKIKPLSLWDCKEKDVMWVANPFDASTYIGDKKIRSLILRVGQKDIRNLSEIIQSLYTNVDKINLIIDGWDILSADDVKKYGKELYSISEIIINYIKENGVHKQLDVLTDILITKDRINCNAGTKNFTLAPNGLLYFCPNSYHDNTDNYIADISGELSYKNPLLSLDNSPSCKICDKSHCKRCIYDNIKKTKEYNVPGAMQCELRKIEREVSMKLQGEIKELEIKTPYLNNLLEESIINDPINYLVMQRDSLYQ